ncbi:MAG: hypothetical protein GF335_02055, partial [Candidatus Moranbacteria bacterium]|nr:hypothetical protein [Candidatus Moranbacteria bacterium]
ESYVKHLLKNNIYGVDINEESVEITKLSLWLKTVKKGEKLTVLKDNIKCGNSLIDDPEVAGDKAFKWEEEFKEIIQKSFVVIETNDFIRYFRKNDSNFKKLLDYAKQGLIELKPTTRVTYEIGGPKSKSVNKKEELELINSFDLQNTVNRWDVSIWDSDYWVGPKEEEAFKKAKQIIFGNQKLNENQKIDVDHFVAALGLGKEQKKADYFITHNTKQFVKGGKREKLENEFKIKIRTVEEFIEEFHKIRSGFDVIVGNPPYLRIQGLRDSHKEQSEFYDKNYISATKNYDIYVLFMEKSFKLIKNDGVVNFILPHKFMISEFGEGIRKFLSENKAVNQIVHFGSNMVFEDASTYTCVIKLSKNNNRLKFTHIEPRGIFNKLNFDHVLYEKISNSNWKLLGTKKQTILDKIDSQKQKIKDIFVRIFQGIATSADKIYLIKGKIKNGYLIGFSDQLQKEVKLEVGFIKPLLKGENVSRYLPPENQYWVIFPYNLKDGKAVSMQENEIKEKYPLAYEYLKENEGMLKAREKGKFDNNGWFLFGRKQGIDFVEKEKIITPEISFGGNMTFDEKGKFYHTTTCYSLVKKDDVKENYKFYLCLLNSNLLWFFLQITGTELRGGYFRYKTKYLEPFGLPKLENIEDQQPFIEKADLMLELNKELYDKLNEVSEFLKHKFEIEKMPKKLEKFYELEFGEFVKALKLKKISIEKESELMKYFNKNKEELKALKEKIDNEDKIIDDMVFDLYGLTEKEKQIVLEG